MLRPFEEIGAVPGGAIEDGRGAGAGSHGPQLAVKLVDIDVLCFVDLFVWLSRSTQKIAHSRVGEQVPLPPVDWGTV